jgi:hypothetical protein
LVAPPVWEHRAFPSPVRGRGLERLFLSFPQQRKHKVSIPGEGKRFGKAIVTGLTGKTPEFPSPVRGRGLESPDDK